MPRRLSAWIPLAQEARLSGIEDESSAAGVILKEVWRRSVAQKQTNAAPPAYSNGFLRSHAYPLVFAEGQKIGVNLVRVGCGHAMRKAGIDLQRGFLK